MNEKNYLAASIKEFTFQNGGTILNASIKFEDLQKIQKNGWVKLKIGKRKQPSDKGATHYCYEDDWQPQQQANQDANTNPQEGQPTHPDAVGQPIYTQDPALKNKVPEYKQSNNDDEEINIEDIPF